MRKRAAASSAICSMPMAAASLPMPSFSIALRVRSCNARPTRWLRKASVGWWPSRSLTANVDSETGQLVDLADHARGYQIGKEEFLFVEDHELRALQIASTHTIEIEAFVPRAQVDLRYPISPYYITPDGKVGQEAFAVIREAMRGKKMVAIAR